MNEPLPKAKEGKEMRWIIYDGDVDAVCHRVEINAISSERPKRGHDRREIHSTDWSEPHPTHTPRDHELKHDLNFTQVWVENMNSVMDDNRLLTLPNGERIRLQPHCCMICETFDLQYASPATISRCGMVWADPKNLGY